MNSFQITTTNGTATPNPSFHRACAKSCAGRWIQTLGVELIFTHQPPLPSTRFGRVFHSVALFTALTVGALQMYHVRGGLLTDYGADVFGTAWLYAMTRLGRTIVQRGRTVGSESAAIIIFVLCMLSEFGQKLHFVPGRFDPYDIAGFAFTVLVCWLIDAKYPFVGAALPNAESSASHAS